MNWISRRIERASWTGFLVWFAVLLSFSIWAFNMDSPWTRALEAAGGILPETKPGIPAIEPVRSLNAMGADKSDYILWQALDIPYAVMNFFFASLGMALGLKALRLEKSLLRFFLLLPAVYVGCEVIENTLVASFASGLLAPGESIVLIQQLATTLKFASGIPALLLALIAVFVGFALNLFRAVKCPW